MSDRMPPLEPSRMTPAQAEAAEQFKTLRGQPVFGPFVPFHRSPDLMLRVAPIGDYMRYRTVLGAKLAEMSILIVARAWNQDVEYAIHAPIALKEGVSADIIAAISEGRRPAVMAPDETLVYEAITEFQRIKTLSDDTYGRMVAMFGEAGLIDLIGLVGYYGMLAGILNVARTHVPDGPRLPRPGG